MSFGRPLLLWLVLLGPLVALAAAWLWRLRLAALERWAGRSLWARLALDYAPSRLVLSLALLALAVAAAGLALSRPRWGTIEENVERRGVDVVFVLDSSLSMAARDVQPSRMEVARHQVRELARRLPGDRVALVQVEGAGVVLAPLTLDTAVIDLLLDAVEPASLPTPGTRLESAFEAALDLFPEGDGKHRVLVLVTDGEDLEGGLEALLERAHGMGVIVHALGVGSLQGGPIPLPGEDGYKRDAEGQVVVTKLGEDLLEHVTGETGGLYVRADSVGTDLGPIVDAIDSMEKRALESQVLSTRAERFQWPLALALCALLGHLVTRPIRPVPDEREAAR
ncbi:MAG: VWA domain-containing protein [Thermoanaerobaculia bacterium]